MQPHASFGREALEKKCNNARANLLLVLAFTVINTVLLVSKSNTYFLFSAYLPYFFVQIGMDLCGMFPAEYYGPDYYIREFFPPVVFYVLLVAAIIITLLYLVCWILSKKHTKIGLIAALIFFGIDSLALLGFAFLGGAEMMIGSMIDIAFHVWVIVSLVMGVHACSQLQRMPAPSFAPPFPTQAPVANPENPEAQAEGYQAPPAANIPNSPILRQSDRHVKHRILLSSKVLDYEVEYRRVKRTNELVINGQVYAEYTALMELAHNLTAYVDGHYFEVGFNGTHSYFRLDHQMVEQKVRLY